MFYFSPNIIYYSAPAKYRIDDLIGLESKYSERNAFFALCITYAHEEADRGFPSKAAITPDWVINYDGKASAFSIYALPLWKHLTF